MVQFRTAVEIPISPWKTGYQKKHLLMGSCFTETMGNRMASLKFDTDINPFGIVFNPASIFTSLRHLLSGKSFEEKDLFFHAGMWHSYQHHGNFSAENPQAALQAMNNRLETSSVYLKNADFLLLTLGTAWVYELKETGNIVANCHKVPQDKFHRYKLTVSDIVHDFRNSFENLWDINPKIRIILTVSPVRHLGDGAIENQRSKATLLLAVDALAKGFGNEKCCYFPSYELVMDELRDYRFYAEDMVHLSSVASDFVWEKFSEWLIDEESLLISKKIASLTRDMNHKPIHRKSEEFEAFLLNSLQKSENLAKSYPDLDFSTEIEYFAKEMKLKRKETPK